MISRLCLVSLLIQYINGTIPVTLRASSPIYKIAFNDVILAQVSFPSQYNSIRIHFLQTKIWPHVSPIQNPTLAPHEYWQVQTPYHVYNLSPGAFLAWPLCLLYLLNLRYSNCFGSHKSQATMSPLFSCTVPFWNVFSHPIHLAPTHSLPLLRRVSSWAHQDRIGNSNSKFFFIFLCQDTR